VIGDIGLFTGLQEILEAFVFLAGGLLRVSHKGSKQINVVPG
jgi:hypothetical protein